MHTFSTRLRRRQQFRQKTLSNIALFLVAIVPIYPVFGSYMQTYTGVVVRGEYDRSTILASYDWETWESTSDFIQELIDTPPETTLFVPEVSVPSSPPPADIVAPREEIKDPKLSLYVTHTVTRGDTLSTIAQKYDIPVSTIRTMNTLSTDILSINQKIVIPRINGVQYVVQKWDTLSTIASKYGVWDINTILIANDLRKGVTLSIGRKLLVPNPTKDPNKKIPPKIAATPKPTNTVSAPKPAKVNVAKKEPVKDQQTITYGGYTLSLKVSKGCRSFVWGNCTCFVAKYKNVTWRWNAKDWLKNAQKQWIPTGDDPKPGAIIVYHWPGFPPAYGHVGIVMEVNSDSIIVKDMNYRALNEVTTRRETFDNPAIIGYIYVD
jgi:surface antigen/LysM repeat protein